jgi:hypothetical protein
MAEEDGSTDVLDGRPEPIASASLPAYKIWALLRGGRREDTEWSG